MGLKSFYEFQLDYVSSLGQKKKAGASFRCAPAALQTELNISFKRELKHMLFRTVMFKVSIIFSHLATNSCYAAVTF